MPAECPEIQQFRAGFRSIVGTTAFMLCAMLVVTSCGDDTAGPAPPEDEEEEEAEAGVPAEILLSLERDSLELEQSTTVSGQVVDSNGDPVEAEIIWISNDPLIAQVNSGGVVTTVAPGVAEISAVAGNLEAKIRVFVLPPFRFVDLSAGAQDTCALTEAGATYCWGFWTESPIPARVAQEHAFVQITSEDHMVCGLTSAGDALCWGQNRYQRMGDSVEEAEFEANPIRIEHSVPFRQIHLGLHGGVCGIEESGTLVCWGHNDFGQVGRGTVSNAETEILPVGVDASFTDVDLGVFRGCGIAEDGQGYCWGHYTWGIGDGVDLTQLDAEETDDVQPPLALAGDLNLSSVASGLYFSCAVAVDNRGYCWGRGDKLGTGDNEDRWAPAEISEHRFSSISAGSEHACGVTTDGQALCWGSGEGRLGTGDNESSFLPRAVAGDIEFLQLSAAQDHTCGISSLGVVYCWGNGQLGREEIAISNEPVPVEWPAEINAD